MSDLREAYKPFTKNPYRNYINPTKSKKRVHRKGTCVYCDSHIEATTFDRKRYYCLKCKKWIDVRYPSRPCTINGQFRPYSPKNYRTFSGINCLYCGTRTTNRTNDGNRHQYCPRCKFWIYAPDPSLRSTMNDNKPPEKMEKEATEIRKILSSIPRRPVRRYPSHRLQKYKI